VLITSTVKIMASVADEFCILYMGFPCESLCRTSVRHRAHLLSLLFSGVQNTQALGVFRLSKVANDSLKQLRSLALRYFGAVLLRISSFFAWHMMSPQYFP
jgi:hypothetical protein